MAERTSVRLKKRFWIEYLGWSHGNHLRFGLYMSAIADLLGVNEKFKQWGSQWDNKALINKLQNDKKLRNEYKRLFNKRIEKFAKIATDDNLKDFEKNLDFHFTHYIYTRFYPQSPYHDSSRKSMKKYMEDLGIG